jgi:hypothetical protein
MRCDNHHDHRHDRTAVKLEFDREELTTTDTPFGLVLSLTGLKSGGEPGAPALPRTQVKIAVPDGTWPHELEILDERWETVVEGGSLVAPAQWLRAGAATPGSSASGRPAKKTAAKKSAAKKSAAKKSAAKKSAAKKSAAKKSAATKSAAKRSAAKAIAAARHDDRDAGDGHDQPHLHCADDCSCRHSRRPDNPATKGFPAPEITPPDPDKYAVAAADPPPAARAVRIDTIGTTHVAVVEVNPVRLTRKGGVELCTSLAIAVRYAAEAPLGDHQKAVAALREQLGQDIDPERVVPRPSPVLTGPAQAERLRDLARSEVLNSDVIGGINWPWPRLDLPSEYLVITDDVKWNAMAIAPTTPVLGMVAQFQRLAAAKRARGISARVVTITDIVNGRFGDFRAGARDLQEVIRRFLKSVRTRWGVSWLLLGGDVGVVPIRAVAGAMQGHITRDSKSSPDDNRSHWTGSYLKMKVVNPGDWWSASTANQLVRSDTGQLIPYDDAATSSTTSAGWFFTASDWSTRSTMPTDYVRVNGPASIANGDMMFLYTWNTLPTDLYYASLASWVVGYHTIDIGFFSFQLPYVYEPEHDWDALGNGIYGQHRLDGTDLDGVHLATDLCVGRAPVDTATDAATFVDKVLTYERLGGGVFTSLDQSWPTRVVLASSDWGGPTRFWPTTSSPPSDNHYLHDAGASRSLLKAPAAPSTFDFELIAHVSDADRRLLPYKSSTASSVRGWYYARSATDLSINELVISLLWVTIRFPMPSPWIVVHGPLAERTPQVYELDYIGQDGSMADQERLRQQVLAELPAIDDFQRLYEDELDLTLSERLAAPVQYLTSARLQSALDTAPHFMSLSGHGNSDGCCGGSVGLARALRNGKPGFIGYADSCLTNMVDGDDAFSEELLTNPDGGAVGYVGNTRFSWIGVGDDFQRAFFHRLTTTRHLGLLNDSRIGVYGTTGSWNGYDRWAVFTLNLLGDPELQVHRSALPRIRLTVIDHVRRVLRAEAIVLQPRPSDPFPARPPVGDIRIHVSAGDHLFDAVTDGNGEVRLPAEVVANGSIEVTASHPDFVTAHEVLEVIPADDTGSCCHCSCHRSDD